MTQEDLAAGTISQDAVLTDSGMDKAVEGGASSLRTVISVRMSQSEVAASRKAAEEAGMKLSTFLRVAALEAARKGDYMLDTAQLGRQINQLLTAMQDIELGMRNVLAVMTPES